MARLHGKVALVTGGSRGIGAAIVKAFAAEGATVHFTFARSPEAAAKVAADATAAGPGRAIAHRADVGSASEVRALFAALDKVAPKLDVLVNNAGVYLTANIADFSDSDFEKTLAVNIGGVYYTTRNAVSRMNDGGRIINLGSIVGETAIGPGHSVYSASKFAVQGFSRGLARDLAPRKITVNTIQPGPIDTDMNPADSTRNPAADFMRQMIPLGRYGTAEEVAAAATFLASPEASFITGSMINVDGGAIA